MANITAAVERRKAIRARKNEIGCPSLFAGGSQQGRLALVLANAHRAGAGLAYVTWAELTDEEQIAWWEAAGKFLPAILG